MYIYSAWVIQITMGIVNHVRTPSKKVQNLGRPSKKREYIKTFDLKEGGGQFENLIFK